MDDRQGADEPERWPEPRSTGDDRTSVVTAPPPADSPMSYWARGVPIDPMDPVPGPTHALSNSLALELDDRGYIVACSRGLSQKVTGYAADDLVGRHLSVLYDPEAVANLQPQRDLSAALASSGVSEKSWRVRADGSRFWATVVLAPRYGGHGDVVGFTVLLHDDSADGAASRGTSTAGAPAGHDPDDVERLHGEVINRLFGVGLTLCGARSLSSQPEVLAHLDEAVDSLDETIRFIRRRLWQLDQEPSTGNGSWTAATAPAPSVLDPGQSSASR